MQTQLYRHFDRDGILLYVGISKNTLSRLATHKSESFWFDMIARVSIEYFNTRKEAATAECVAIRVEKPKYNIVFSRPTIPVQKRQQKTLYKKLRLIKETRYPQCVNLKKHSHTLDDKKIVERNETIDEHQLVNVWCNDHNCYEWHWWECAAFVKRPGLKFVPARRNGGMAL